MGFGGGYECASSTLLCLEDNKSILGFDVFLHDDRGDDGSRDEEEEDDDDDYGGGFDFMNFPLQSDQCLALMVSQESHHLPRDDYSSRLLTGSLDISLRREAIDWIGKVCIPHSLQFLLFPLNREEKTPFICLFIISLDLFNRFMPITNLDH